MLLIPKESIRIKCKGCPVRAVCTYICRDEYVLSNPFIDEYSPQSGDIQIPRFLKIHHKCPKCGHEWNS